MQAGTEDSRARRDDIPVGRPGNDTEQRRLDPLSISGGPLLSTVKAMATATKQASFGPEEFSFLADLRANNDRDWFAANKRRFEEHLLEPALAFIEDFTPRLEKISPHFRADARPSGGSLFRIYRDTRFSKDKSPYKTNLGIHFRHERAKDAHAPGYYLHIGPGEVSPAAASGSLARKRGTRIREAIVADPERWKKGHARRRLREAARARRRLPSSASPPGRTPSTRSRTTSSGRPSSAGRTWREDDVVAPGFIDEYERICRAAAPLLPFLCGALDVPY